MSSTEGLGGMDSWRVRSNDVREPEEQSKDRYLHRQMNNIQKN